MTQTMRGRVHCRHIPKAVCGPYVRRKLPHRTPPPRRCNGAEKEPIEKMPLAPYPTPKTLRESEAWNQFFASLQTLEGEVVDKEVGLIVRALKFAMLASRRNPLEFPFMGRLILQKAISLASLLISFHYAKNPYVDSETIAASLVMEQVAKDQISLDDVKTALGPEVCALTRTTLEIRALIDDVDVLEDVTARKIQEVVFERCDNRAILLQFISSFDTIFHSRAVPREMQVPLAYDCLYVNIGLGRSLGLDDMATQMEEFCMEILFPSSHAEIAAHLQQATSSSEGVFKTIRSSLERGMEERLELQELVDRVEIKTRVKSTSSFLRKELSLTELAKGGRKKEEIYDTLGVRVIAWPRHETELYSEEMAVKGCYVISDIAHGLWPVIPSRSKDYIKRPKPNGYRSLHSTHKIKTSIPSIERESAAEGLRSYPTLDAFYDNSLIINDPAENDGDLLQQNVVPTERDLTFELQIRTKKMDDEAEHGRASHALYKSGLDQRRQS